MRPVRIYLKHHVHVSEQDLHLYTIFLWKEYHVDFLANRFNYDETKGKYVYFFEVMY
ncbi:hypothetical protein [Roseovarius Plymouth podovirus 1]|uniref:Uncharacterized protein n=1 Tax=Roseovarius Plymouth podovirus 1 TaxID=926474 RepID=K4Q592_9CAUD|nr:hypothetical protein HYO70_gp17 [Roseovarius Plymouth podovirus 1]CBX87947.1 hypothetical protein [Roseovarius Plymouth podovirus 1]